MLQNSIRRIESDGSYPSLGSGSPSKISPKPRIFIRSLLLWREDRSYKIGHSHKKVLIGRTKSRIQKAGHFMDSLRAKVSMIGDEAGVNFGLSVAVPGTTRSRGRTGIHVGNFGPRKPSLSLRLIRGLRTRRCSPVWNINNARDSQSLNLIGDSLNYPQLPTPFVETSSIPSSSADLS